MRVYAITATSKSDGQDKSDYHVEVKFIAVEDDEEVDNALYVGDVDKVEQINVWHVARRPNDNRSGAHAIGDIEPIISKSSFRFSGKWDGPFPHQNAYNVKSSKDEIFFPTNVLKQQLKFVVVPAKHRVSSMKLFFSKSGSWVERVAIPVIPGMSPTKNMKARKAVIDFTVKPISTGESRRIIDVYVRPDQYYTRVPFPTRLRLAMTNKLRLKVSQINEVFYEAEERLVPSALTHIIRAANEEYVGAVESQSIKEPLHKRICCLLHRLDPDQYQEIALGKYPMLFHVGGCFAGCPSTKLPFDQLLDLARKENEKMLPGVDMAQVYDDIEVQMTKVVDWQPLDAHMSLPDLLSIVSQRDVLAADFATSVAKVRGCISIKSLVAKDFIPQKDMNAVLKEVDELATGAWQENSQYLEGAGIPMEIVRTEIVANDEQRFEQLVYAFGAGENAFHAYHYGRIQAMNASPDYVVFDGGDEDVWRYYCAGVLSCQVSDQNGSVILQHQNPYSMLSNTGIVLSDGTSIDFQNYPYPGVYYVGQHYQAPQEPILVQQVIHQHERPQSWLPSEIGHTPYAVQQICIESTPMPSQLRTQRSWLPF